ncbi:MBL fold metallo-hydrolase [Metabacillus fastidiosus]|uniref:MBL fold metallo-hydrolase n=1 Tax=Metabacillus fastidiosus TaxID=1458 RepID=A0ABU6NW26_9BACI|nr:MBL fold metallo-hydrolase [Metabacillus fastidiosus]MED4400923.1 MBL fold metallo-hydrolase [Metabacillus fastidiosus]MED4453500.1 MBL fold metallo-hydrolase [Metabacillus fastidiosus]MED4463849.1 MBL fold metallo-hydrolase [Metabacillus fastidiosus]
MKWERLPLGPLQTNCYVLSNSEKEALIFDPGGEAPKLNNLLKARKLKPLAIFLTHAHFDHIGAVEDVRKEWGIPVYIHKNEQHWLQDPSSNGSQLFLAHIIQSSEADEIIRGEGKLEIGSFHFEIFETPGHSPGSVSYYFEEAGVVFSGDALFEGSIGRTDLPGGDHAQLIKSIHEKLLNLPEETIVLSGHGLETTIGQEMDSNPFLNGF